MKLKIRRTSGYRWSHLFWEQLSGNKAEKTIVKSKKKKPEVKIHVHIHHKEKK